MNSRRGGCSVIKYSDKKNKNMTGHYLCHHLLRWKFWTFQNAASLSKLIFNTVFRKIPTIAVQILEQTDCFSQKNCYQKSYSAQTADPAERTKYWMFLKAKDFRWKVWVVLIYQTAPHRTPRYGNGIFLSYWREYPLKDWILVHTNDLFLLRKRNGNILWRLPIVCKLESWTKSIRISAVLKMKYNALNRLEKWLY